tara:strand:+ start:1806 stop:2000 length:195 start_codon:yes stop_codon:yes gene_type:complete
MMKINCNFTMELKTSDDFKKVIQYMKDIDVYDDYVTRDGLLTRSAIRKFIKSEAEDWINFRIFN